MAPQATINDLSDVIEKSGKELLHEDLQSHLAKILKACTRHVSYAIPKPEFLERNQGTEDRNLLTAINTVQEITAVAESQINALKWDLVAELLNPGSVTSQSFKKACYIRHEHLLANRTSSLLDLANLYEEREKSQKKCFGVKSENGVELVLPSISKKRKVSVLGQGLFASSSPVANITAENGLANESRLKKINDMSCDDMAMELKLRNLRSSGIKQDLATRLKVARCDAYRTEEAAWADQLSDAELDRISKQSVNDLTDIDTREKLKTHLYENPAIKTQLEAKLAKREKSTKPGKPIAKIGSSTINPFPKLVTTSEEPLRLRRLLLLGYPSDTNERDIAVAYHRYGVLFAIKQGPGEFFVDCDTEQNAKQAVAEMRFHLLGNTMSRCVLEADYLAEKRKEKALEKEAAEKQMTDFVSKRKNYDDDDDDEPMSNYSSRRPKKEWA